MKKALYIYGAGGLGREILALVKALDVWEVVAFIDDGVKKNTTVGGIPVVGGAGVLRDLDAGTNVVLAFGDPLVKEKLAASIGDRLINPVLIHPRAILESTDTITLGKGTIITAGCVLTTDIRIGDHVLINLSTTIGHDTVIESYCSVMPGVNIAGGVTLGSAVLIGSGANIKNGLRVGNRSRVGMGSVVIRDVADNVTVAGVPAKPIGA